MTTYEVTAKTGYAGHKQGDEFEAELSEDEERRATARGSIRVASKSKREEGSDG
jgi:hypothetical protein